MYGILFSGEIVCEMTFQKPAIKVEVNFNGHSTIVND